MSITKEEAQIIKQALTAEARTRTSLDHALKRLQSLLPISGDGVTHLSEDETLLVDAFLKRFENVLAVATKQVFRALLLIEEEDYRRMSQAEMLATLERWGVLASAERWLAAVAARNRIAHEYPEPPEVSASHLNDAFAAASDVLTQLGPVVARLALRLGQSVVTDGDHP